MLTTLPGQQFTQQPLFAETWFIIKTTSMLLFADLVDHKIHLSAFMWETELATAGCPNNGRKCWSRGHSSWGKHYSNRATQVTRIKPQSWHHTFLSAALELKNTHRQTQTGWKSSYKTSLNLRREIFPWGESGITQVFFLFFFLKKQNLGLAFHWR